MHTIFTQNNKKRILIHYSYDGTGFHGSALQGNERTVEKVINDAISKLTNEVTELISASRTDTGVHARDNIAVFDTGSSIPPERFAPALNSYLPGDVRINSSESVPGDFHPRKTDTKKTYGYNIYLARTENPLKERYAVNCSYDLDIEAMNLAASHIIGEHDFSCFCAAGSSAVSKVRTIYDCRVLGYKDLYDTDNIIIRITGSGFLYNMVRIIAGTLMEVGRGRFKPDYLKEIIEKKDRTLAGPTAPAKGLVLESYEIL